jgi:hypothetical protein
MTQRVELVARFPVLRIAAGLPENIADVDDEGEIVRIDLSQDESETQSFTMQCVIRGVTEDRKRERTGRVRGWRSDPAGGEKRGGCQDEDAQQSLTNHSARGESNSGSVG